MGILWTIKNAAYSAVGYKSQESERKVKYEQMLAKREQDRAVVTHKKAAKIDNTNKERTAFNAVVHDRASRLMREKGIAPERRAQLEAQIRKQLNDEIKKKIDADKRKRSTQASKKKKVIKTTKRRPTRAVKRTVKVVRKSPAKPKRKSTRIDRLF